MWLIPPGRRVPSGAGCTSSAEMVVLFDGVCNLCSRSVLFIIRRDPAARFRFSSLQSAYGARQLAQFGINSLSSASVVLIRDHRAFQKSDAVLEIVRHLHGAWPFMYVFKVVPRYIRDGMYDWVAAKRYRWLGKKTECWVPAPELLSRFINS